MFVIETLNKNNIVESKEEFINHLEAEQRFLFQCSHYRKFKGLLTLKVMDVTKWQFDVDPKTADTERWITKIDLFSNNDDMPKYKTADEIVEQYGIAKRKIYVYTQPKESSIKVESKLIYWLDFVKHKKLLYINEKNIEKMKPNAPKHSTNKKELLKSQLTA